MKNNAMPAATASVVQSRAAVRKRSRTEFVKRQILEAAARLFNERGFGDVAVQSIADEVGMSLGNLQYHFKTKVALVLAIQPLMEAEVHQALSAPPAGFSPRAAAEYHIRILTTLWNYRFFFNALPVLLNADQAVRKSYYRFNEKIITDFRRAFDNLIKSGSMAPIRRPNSTSLIATNLWACLVSWLKFEHVKNPDKGTPERKMIIGGALQNLSLLQLYFPSNFTGHVMRNVRLLLKDTK